MSSLLTNNSAMVALGTLRTINRDMGTVQDQISTGKKIATARDNAALWSIAAVMKSDVTGFRAISESLSLGTATLNVGREGAEAVAGLLDQLKGRVVAAQEDNVDRVKVQADVAQLVDQIRVVVAGTQFNGLNLLNSEREISVLASLNRDSTDGITANVEPDYVRFFTHNLGDDAGETGTGGAITVGAGDPPVSPDIVTTPATVPSGGSQDLAFEGRAAQPGDSYSLTVTNNDTTPATEFVYTYVAGRRDTMNDVVSGLARQISLRSPAEGGTLTVTRAADPEAGNPVLRLEGFGAELEVALATQTEGTRPTGRLFMLGDLDVSTKESARAALDAMEWFIQGSISAASEFGSAQGAIDSAGEFVGKLMDSLTSGIGAMVDADMEAASARLQALQVQQQLGIQALSIANQQPQNILALFQG